MERFRYLQAELASPKISFWITSGKEKCARVQVGNILLGNREKRHFFFENQYDITQWVDIATVLQDLPTHEARIEALENGTLDFCGEKVCIKRKK